MESPLCQMITEGNKIQPLEGLLLLHGYKGLTQDMDIAQTMVRIEIEED